MIESWINDVDYIGKDTSTAFFPGWGKLQKENLLDIVWFEYKKYRNNSDIFALVT